MLLLVGLGNPGGRYAGTRHNIGFTAVKAIAHRYDFGQWRRAFEGTACEGYIAGVRAMLLLPETFMNESGRSVGQAMRYRKLSLEDITVFHDEIELPPGKVRVKTGGGIAGHNGLRSISEHVGNDYRRVRIGIGRPASKDLVEHYVLSEFSRNDRPWVEALVTIISDNAGLLVRGEDASFQNKVHLAMATKGFGDGKSEDDSDKNRKSND
jgi:PTH1 family peptidyl-tRNA hydrolase